MRAPPETADDATGSPDRFERSIQYRAADRVVHDVEANAARMLLDVLLDGRCTVIDRHRTEPFGNRRMFQAAGSEHVRTECASKLNCHVTDAARATLHEHQLLSAEAELGQDSSRLFIEQLLDLMCTHLLRAHSVFSLPKANLRRGLAAWQVKRVTSYMQENLGEEIGLQELANVVNLSRFYFCSAFRMATGYTPHQWLTKLRIDQARRLLSVASMSITEIALTVGYQTPSAFAAAFRRVVGVSPRTFRRRL